jgi:ABC-2 type transport system permease protein
LALSGLIVAYGASVEGIALTPGLVLAYALLTAVMTLLYYDMELILRTLPFLAFFSNGADQLEGSLLELNFHVPGVLFKGGFKVLFYFIMPYGIMATVPAQLLSGVLTARGLIHALAAALIFTAFALRFWKFGLKWYKSAGS